MRRSQQRGRKTELFSDLEAFQHRSVICPLRQMLMVRTGCWI